MIELYIKQVILHKTNFKFQIDSKQLTHASSALKDNTEKSFQFWLCKQ